MAREIGYSTRSVHAASHPDPATRAIVTPIVQSAAFAFPDLATWRAVVEHTTHGDVYGRNSHPTERALAERMAELEGAGHALTFATGMAAITTTLLAFLRPGQRAVAVRDAYGATYLLFTEILPEFGVDCVVVDTDDEAVEAALAQGTDLLYVETPTNPTLKVLDLERLARRGHEVGATVVVDNTFATPINQLPLRLGADLVLHSATKYLGGHGDVLGGIVCGARDTLERVYRFRELTGPGLDANSAFLLLRSLKTLGLRVARQNANALAVASFLADHAAVARTHYPGLESHPGHEVAGRQMRGFGGVLSFELVGGAAATERLLPRLQFANLAANLGQVETTVGPASLTSHVELDQDERRASGVPDHLIRYAAGIEDPEDLIDDLATALNRL